MTNWTRVLGGGAVGAAVAVAGYVLWSLDRLDTGGDAGPGGDEQTAALTVPEPANQTQAPSAEPEETPAPDADEAPNPPSFDLIRIEADGSALVAGQGAPDTRVTVFLDGDEIANLTSGSDGKFASLMEIPPSPQPRMMTLAMHVDDGPVFSETEIIVAPFGTRAEDPVSAPEVAQQTARQTEDSGTEEAQVVEAPATDIAPEPTEDAAPAEPFALATETELAQDEPVLNLVTPDETGVDVIPDTQQTPATVEAEDRRPAESTDAAQAEASAQDLEVDDSETPAPAVTGAATATGVGDTASVEDGPAADAVAEARGQPTEAQVSATGDTAVARSPDVTTSTEPTDQSDEVAGTAEPVDEAPLPTEDETASSAGQAPRAEAVAEAAVAEADRPVDRVVEQAVEPGDTESEPESPVDAVAPDASGETDSSEIVTEMLPEPDTAATPDRAASIDQAPAPAQGTDMETATAETEVEPVEVTRPAANTGTPEAANDSVGAFSQPTSRVEPDQTEAETPDTEASPKLLASDEEGVRVLPGPEVLDRVAIDTISYDEAGEVALAGRGVGTEGGGFVRVYLDNTPITTSRIRSDGSWRVDLPEVDKGVYTLRVDEVDAAGEVRSRAETPFLREDREALERAGEDVAGGPVKVVTVQPGNTLWQIARDRYGEGLLYVRVFDANKSQIRDPDLIYPGQVFDLPAEEERAIK